MTDSERIIELKKYLAKSFRQIAADVGLATVQTLYDIKNGKHGISKEVAEKIQARYLNISLVWLLTGEGNMLVEDNSIQIEHSDGNTSLAGSHNVNSNNVNSSRTIDKAIDEISEMRKLVQKRDEQIDRLITVIEKITDKTED